MCHPVATEQAAQEGHRIRRSDDLITENRKLEDRLFNAGTSFLEGTLTVRPVYFINMVGEDDAMAAWLQQQPELTDTVKFQCPRPE